MQAYSIDIVLATFRIPVRLVQHMIYISLHFKDVMEKLINNSKVRGRVINTVMTKFTFLKFALLFRETTIAEDINVPSFLVIDVIIGLVNNFNIFKFIPMSVLRNDLEEEVALLKALLLVLFNFVHFILFEFEIFID